MRVQKQFMQCSTSTVLTIGKTVASKSAHQIDDSNKRHITVIYLQINAIKLNFLGYPPASANLNLAAVQSSFTQTSRQKPIPHTIPPPCSSSQAIDLSNQRSPAAEHVTVVIPSADYQLTRTVSQSSVKDSTAVVSDNQPITAVIPAAAVAANESTEELQMCTVNNTPSPPSVIVNADLPVLGKTLTISRV